MRKQTIDVSKGTKRVNARLNGPAKENPVPMAHGEGELPYDLPARIEVQRVMGPVANDRIGNAEQLLGHVLRIVAFTKRTAVGEQVVEVQFLRDPNALYVVVNREVVWKWIENNDDLPGTPSGVRELQGQVDAGWAEILELRPGDFVDVDAHGSPVVTRVEDEEIIEDDEEIIMDDDDEIIEDEEDDFIEED